jgi:UDP-glucose 4-epimerase
VSEMHALVTGGAGFIGSHLVERLLNDGHTVTAADNLSTGRREFLSEAEGRPGFEFVETDLLQDVDELRELVRVADAVFHLAANADVRYGWEDPERDLSQNVIVTHKVLEAMRLTGTSRILFASTGSVYGEAPVIPTPEDAPMPVQTSLYGASKLAAEGYVESYVEGVGFSATIFRFVSVLGPRYTHGHVIDFVRSLRADPTRLCILGDGTQRKSYLEVSDCIAAMTSVLEERASIAIYNLGVDDSCTVKESAAWICERLGIEPRFEYAGGNRGWVGDNPHIHLDTTKIRSTGWRPKYSIREAVENTVDYLLAEPWVLDLSESRVNS